MKQSMLLATSLVILIGLPFHTLAADAPENIGPEVITLKMGANPLIFQHRKHQSYNNSECFHCHKPQEWKIKKWDKEVAHEVCIACHDINDKGPVECKGCHTAK